MPKQKKKLLALALICLSASGCDQLPPFPTVEVKLVDYSHNKIQLYELPKKRGENPVHKGFIPYAPVSIERHVCLHANEYSKLEEYISAVEDIASRRCR